MSELTERVKNIIKKGRESIDKGENFLKAMNGVYLSLFDLSRETKSKELTIVALLWSGIRSPLTAIIESGMEKTFPQILKKNIEGKNRELARSFLSLLSRKDLRDIMYAKLINYQTEEVNFEEISSTFGIKNLELPVEEKGFILFTIARTLEEALKRVSTEYIKFIKEYIDKLDDSLSSIEKDEEVLNKLREITEELAYEAHLKALGG